MRVRDRLWVSARHVRGRLVESILVILATAVGVALVAAMSAFIRSYNNQTDYLLSHPAYRELLVEAVGNETELDEPVVEYDAETTREAALGFDAVQAALDDTPAIAYGYLADAERLSTRGPGAGGLGAGRGMMGGAPEGGFPPPEPRAEGADGDEGTRGAFAELRERLAQAGEAGEGPGAFDLEQFFQTDSDVLTELPLDAFSGLRVTADFLPAYGLSVAEGSGITEEDVESGNQVIVLGSSLARTLFPAGDAVGTRVRLNFQTYTVAGILAPTELRDTNTGASYNEFAYVPSVAARVTFGGTAVRINRGTRTLRFAVGDSADLEVAAAQLEAHFDAEYGDGAVRITAPLHELRTEREKLGRILAVVLFLAAAGLFIASINLFNLMLMRVIRRTKGIGITRAVGASRGEIFRQFINESAFMSLTGAVVGLAASPLVFRLLRSALVAEAAVRTAVSWPFLVVGAAGAFLFSVLFGVIPARQAGRIDAAVAIRTE